MNILEYRRRALGYTYREGGDYDYGTPAAPAPAPAAAAQSDPQTTRASIAASLGVPVGSVAIRYGTKLGGRDDNVELEDTSKVVGFAVKHNEQLGSFFDPAGNTTGYYVPKTASSFGEQFVDALEDVAKVALVAAAGYYGIPWLLNAGAAAAGAAGAGTAGAGAAAATGATVSATAGAAASGFTVSGFLAAPGLTIGTALGITNPVAAALAGNIIIQTATNGGNVEQAIKGAVLSAGLDFAGSAVSGAVNSALKTVDLPAIVKTGISNGASSLVNAAITGQNPLDALKGSALSTAINGVVKSMPSIGNLPKEARSLATAAVTAYLTGKDITNATLNAALAEGKKAAAGYIDVATGLSPDVKAIANAYKDPSRALDVAPAQGAAGTDFKAIDALASNAGNLTTDMSAEDAQSILGTTGVAQPGVVTAGLDTGTATDAGVRGGKTTDQPTQLKDESGSALKLTDKEINALVAKQLIFDGGDYNTKQDAANAARLAGYTQFDYDNSVYSMTGPGPTEKDVFQALIDDAPNKKDAFRIARNLLGADKVFDYKGASLTTSYYKPTDQPDQQVLGDGTANTSRAGTRVGAPVTTTEGMSYLTDQEKSVNQRISEAYKGSTLSKIVGTPDDALQTLISMKDIALGPAKGTVGAVKWLADSYSIITGDIGNPVSESMRGLLNNLDELTGDKTKATLKTMQAVIDAAAKDGQGSAAWETAKQLVTHPDITAGLVTQAIGTVFPSLAVAAPMLAAGVPLAAATSTAIAINALSQGGSVAQSAYEHFINQGMADPGLSIEQVQALALTAGKTALVPATAISAVINSLPGGKLFEKALLGSSVGVGKTTLAEAIQEPLDEVFGQVVLNYVTNQDLDKNTGQAAVIGSVAGAGAGAIAGASRITPAQATQVLQEAGIKNPSASLVTLIASNENLEVAKSEAASYILVQAANDPSVLVEQNTDIAALQRAGLTEAVINNITANVAANDASTSGQGTTILPVSGNTALQPIVQVKEESSLAPAIVETVAQPDTDAVNDPVIKEDQPLPGTVTKPDAGFSSTIAPDTVVGIDADGKPVTMADILDLPADGKRIEPTIDPSTVIGVDEDGKPVTWADAQPNAVIPAAADPELKIATDAGFPDFATYTRYGGNLVAYNADKKAAENLQIAQAAGFLDIASYSLFGGDKAAYDKANNDAANIRTATIAGFPDYAKFVEYDGDFAKYSADKIAEEKQQIATAAGFPDHKTYLQYNGDKASYDAIISVAAGEKLATEAGFPNNAKYTQYNGNLAAYIAAEVNPAVIPVTEVAPVVNPVVEPVVEPVPEVTPVTPVVEPVPEVTPVTPVVEPVPEVTPVTPVVEPPVVTPPVVEPVPEVTPVTPVVEPPVVTPPVVVDPVVIDPVVVDPVVVDPVVVDPVVVDPVVVDPSVVNPPTVNPPTVNPPTVNPPVVKPPVVVDPPPKQAGQKPATSSELIDPYKPGFADIGFKTSGNAKFEGPLDKYLRMVAVNSYAGNPQEIQQNQQVDPVQDELSARQEPGSNYFTYGPQNDIDLPEKPGTQMLYSKAGGLATQSFAGGGTTRHGRYAGGGLGVIEHSGKARLDFRTGNAVTGPGDGQSDDIPAMLADGEFVFPADVVAALGNGSTKAGSDKLYDMMHSIRSYHRSAKPKDLPPPAKKSPLDYLKKRKVRR
jgi:hypothetical protein